jgi:hypothetical protein
VLYVTEVHEVNEPTALKARLGRSRRAAGLVASYEQAAIVIGRLRRTSHAKPARRDQILPG